MKEELAAARTLEPKFVLLHDQGCDLIAYDPALFHNAPGKAAIASSLRRRANEINAHGALIGVDSFAFRPDLAAISGANEKLVRAAAAAGIDALVRAGFGVKREAIAVSLQTPAFHLLFQQIYTRGVANSIVFGDLVTVDSRDYDGDPVIAMGWFNVFPLGRPARA
jgi:hypothetical protein